MSDLHPGDDRDLDHVSDEGETILGSNPEDSDSDDDHVDDGTELAPGDTDGDGTPDYRDPDDDGDGVPTIDEVGQDVDCDGIDNHLDADHLDGPCAEPYTPTEPTTPTPPTDRNPQDRAGCGCTTTPAPTPIWLALLALVARRSA